MLFWLCLIPFFPTVCPRYCISSFTNSHLEGFSFNPACTLFLSTSSSLYRCLPISGLKMIMSSKKMSKVCHWRPLNISSKHRRPNGILSYSYNPYLVIKAFLGVHLWGCLAGALPAVFYNRTRSNICFRRCKCLFFPFCLIVRYVFAIFFSNLSFKCFGNVRNSAFFLCLQVTFLKFNFSCLSAVLVCGTRNSVVLPFSQARRKLCDLPIWA